MSAKTVTGAMVLCYINSNLYGRVSSFSWDSETAHKSIHAVDSSDPYELGMTQTKVSGSLGVYRLKGDGGAQGAGMATRYEDVPRGKYFTITVIDKSTDLVLFEAKQCVLQSESWSVSTKGILSGALKFDAINWHNEV